MPLNPTTIHAISEDSPVLLGFSLLASCVLLFMQKFCDLLCMQSTEITKQNKQQRPSSNVHNTHTTQEESAESSKSDFTGAIFFFHRYKRSYEFNHILFTFNILF